MSRTTGWVSATVAVLGFGRSVAPRARGSLRYVSFVGVHQDGRGLVAFVLALPLVAVAAFGFSRSTHDPPFDGTRAAPSSSAPAIDRLEAPRLARSVPALPEGATDSPLVTLTESALYLGRTYVTTAPGTGAADRYRGSSELRIPGLFGMLEALRAPSGPGPAPGTEPFLVPESTSNTPVEDERPDRLRLHVTETVPYRALVEVLYTAGQAGFSTVYLLARGPGQEAVGALEWQAPRYGGCTSGEHVTIGVLLLPDGVAVRSDEKPIGPDCIGNGPGLTLPGPADPSRIPKLVSCIAKARGSVSGQPEVRVEGPAHPLQALLATCPTSAVRVSAHPSTPIRDVFEALLALREPDGALPELGVAISGLEAWPTRPARRHRDVTKALDALGKLKTGASLPTGVEPGPVHKSKK